MLTINGEHKFFISLKICKYTFEINFLPDKVETNYLAFESKIHGVGLCILSFVELIVCL